MISDLPENKADAIRRLQEEAYQAPPGQDFDIYRMEPGDAWGVARCFFEVYGEHYPFDDYYVPEKLIAADRLGQMIPVVARTPTGDIIGFGSLFHNFAHNPRLYESGQATVIPAYRGTLAILGMQDYLFDTIAPTMEELDGLFGEPVCTHLVMQKISSIFGFVDTGLELGLMPGETYHQGDASSDRVSTVLSFKILRDRPGRIWCPAVYKDVLGSIVSKMPISRTVEVSSAPIPQGASSRMDAHHFGHAGVARLSVSAVGEDFRERLAEEEEQALTRGAVVVQVLLNLGEPWCGRAVEHLRESGFFFGGFLPQWFETDGLLMQKVSVPLDLDAIQLLSEDSRKLLAFIRNDQRDRTSRAMS